MKFDAISTDDAFAEGFATGRSGESFRLCPYPFLSSMRSAWLDGYRLAINPPPRRPELDFRTCVGGRA